MGSMPPEATATLEGAFTRLARTVLGGAAASITFSGLDTSNKIFRMSGFLIKDGSSGVPAVRFNNDAGGNYDTQHLNSDAATVSATRVTAQTFGIHPNFNLNANERMTMLFHVAKQQAGDEAIVVWGGAGWAAGVAQRFMGGIWQNTGALISRIDLLAGTANFAVGTVLLLEGNATT